MGISFSPLTHTAKNYLIRTNPKQKPTLHSTFHSNSSILLGDRENIYKFSRPHTLGGLACLKNPPCLASCFELKSDFHLLYLFQWQKHRKYLLFIFVHTTVYTYVYTTGASFYSFSHVENTRNSPWLLNTTFSLLL